MKNCKIFTAIVVAFAAYSCIADATEDLGVQVGNGEGQTTIALSFGELTKVQLGEKADEVYPLYWSEGDAIAVNGVASNELTGVGENATEAQFIVEGVSYPLNIVYPAPTITEAEVTEEGEAVAVYPVVFPAVQQYVAGNVDPKAVVLYGYTAAEPTAPVQLNHLTGVLQINVKGAVTLTQLTVNARSGNIAGTYNVDCATGTLTEVNASNTVTMTFDGGLALNAETATPIYVAVPAGSHGAVWVTLHTATDKMTVKFDSANEPVSAGKVREFKEFYYEANTKDEDSEEFVIDGVDKLIEFATSKAANFFPLTKAVVTADIDMTGVEWTPIENFGAFEFDGGEHTITGLSAPLFGTTSAHIHDLTLANVALNITDNGNSGAFARRIIGGSLRHCSATGTSTIDCSSYDSPDLTNSYFVYAHGGLVGYVNATVIDNCTNNVNITIANNYAGEEGNIRCKSAIGGIAGSFSDLSSFTNLINNGSITYTGTTQKGTMYISGIVGRDVEGGATTTNQAAAFDNCTNNGDIMHTGSSTAGINLSGIVGYLPAADLTCTNLVNNGQVLCKGATVAAYVAGICSNAFGANMKDCQNTNLVGIGSGTKNVGLAFIAGIAAYGITTGKTMDNCDNSGKVVINIETIALKENSFACLAGIIGVIRGNNCVVKNCDNSGQVSQKVNAANASAANSGSLMGGICALITGDDASIQNCNNSGIILQEAISGSSAHTSTLAIGGILGTNLDKVPCTISGCENTGVVVNNAAKPGSQDVGTGGIAGILGSGGVVSECTNRAVVEGTGDSGTYFGMGGVVGMNLRGSVKILNCKNYGEIRQNDTNFKKGNNVKTSVTCGAGFGGVVGLARCTQEISGCENHGTFLFNNTNYGSKSEVHFYVGGVIGGYFHTNTTDPAGFAKTIKNCTNYANLTLTGIAGWYYAGGVIGGIMTYENANHYWAEISGLKNYGDLNFNTTASAGTNPKQGFGGVIGYTESWATSDAYTNPNGFIALNGCEFYGNITTNGLKHVTDNLGIIMGCTRDLHIAKSSKIGGYIDATKETTTTGGSLIQDPDTEDWIPNPEDPIVTVTTYTGGTALSAENIHEYLYKGGIDAAVATTDGYTILTERPAAPAVSEQ